jgi:hypothetical protein
MKDRDLPTANLPKTNIDRKQKRSENLPQAKLTLLNLVGLESLKLFIRYQIDFKIEANGVTPIPAPTRRTVSNYGKNS